MRNLSLSSAISILLVLGASGVGLGCGSDDGGHANDEGTTGGETATQPIDDVPETPVPPTETAGGSSTTPSTDPSCVGTTCVAGQHCEIVQVQCIRAPCPPLPQCVDD